MTQYSVMTCVLAAFLAGCPADETADTTPDPIDDTETVPDTTPDDTDTVEPEPQTVLGQWDLRLYEVPGGGIVGSTLENSVLFLDKGEVNIFGDCNTCSATYTAGADALSIDVIACTRRACTESEETEFFAALENVWSWSREDDTLRLSYDGGGPKDEGVIELTFVPPETL